MSKEAWTRVICAVFPESWWADHEEDERDTVIDNMPWFDPNDSGYPEENDSHV